MIVLDTNVVSELTRAAPDAVVLSRVNALDANDVYITSMTASELLYGVAIMPDGKRRTIVSSAVAQLLGSVFAGRILAFDEAAAVEYARLASSRRARGVAIGLADTIIAATVMSNGASALYTRNIGDFPDIPTVDPWAP